MKKTSALSLSLLPVLLSLGCRATGDGGTSRTSPTSEAASTPAPPAPSGEPEQASPPAASAKSAPPIAREKPQQTAAEATVKKRTYRVAALGDSITDESVGGGGYLRYLRKACPKSTFVDFGRGGDMTNQMRRRLQGELLPAHRGHAFDTLIVFGGVNDLYSDLTAGRTNEKIEAELSSIYAAAQEAELRVVAITVSPWGGFSRYFNERRGRNTQLLNSWILGGPAAGRVDVAVDAYALLSCGAPEKLCPQFEKRRPDGLHPGKLGQERLGEALLQQAFPHCE